MKKNARTFLESLYRESDPAAESSGSPAELAHAAPMPRTPDELPSDWRIEWEERSAIREYDGGQVREHAEAEAFREILARMKADKELG